MADHASPAAAPQVSVLLPVHNGGAFLEPAVRSMMAQTLREIEIVVVDDGSTDDTPAVLDRLAAEDPRIVVSRLSPGLRLPGALNHGLGLARAPLVARMDADDLSHPTRLEVQKRFMEARPEVVICGTGSRTIDPADQVLRLASNPRTAAMCRWTTRFRCPLRHPSVMFRHMMPDGTAPRYEPAYNYAEDYELFARMAGQGDMVELPDVLLDYRVHPASITSTRRAEQMQLSQRISRRTLAAQLPAAVVEALDPAIRAFFDRTPEPPARILAGLRAMLRHDLSQGLGDPGWLRRKTADLAFETLARSGLSRAGKLAAFAGPGRDFAAHLAASRLQAALPARLRPAAPDVRTAPAARG